MFRLLADLSANSKQEYLLDVREKCLEDNVNVAGKTNILKVLHLLLVFISILIRARH